MESIAWASGHATFFFAVPHTFKNAEKMGSVGGGLNFKAGVTTKIIKSEKIQIFWNGNAINAKVSRSAVEIFKQKTGIDAKVRIHHESRLPIGYGLSTSGAGALGTLLALNHLYDQQIADATIYDLAHLVELKHHTGLGSVVGQCTGGIEFRLTQGNPSNCKTMKISSDEEIYLLFFGPLSTSNVLTSPEQMKLVTETGLKLLEDVKKQTNLGLDTLFSMGNYFMNHCGLITPRLQNFIKKLYSINETQVTMSMIGETLVLKPNSSEVLNAWLTSNKINFLKTKISDSVPRVMNGM